LLVTEALLTALVMAPVSWNFLPVGLAGAWSSLPRWNIPRLSDQASPLPDMMMGYMDLF